MADTPSTPKQRPYRPKRSREPERAKKKRQRRAKNAQIDTLKAAQEHHRRLLRARYDDSVITESLANIQAARRKLSGRP